MTDDAVIGPVQPPELHVMTYNVRRRIPHIRRQHPDRWTHRMPLLQALLRAELPTLLGTQETMPDQADATLDGLGPGYRMIGTGRSSNGNGERNAVYFDSRRLSLVEWSQTSLSDTPDVPGSRSWGNLLPRIVVSAIFDDLATGGEFLFINTHFDPLSPGSRTRSAHAIRHLAAASSRPVIVTGDFNTVPGSRPHATITGDVLRDLWQSSPHKLGAAWGTHPNYRRPRSGGRRLDWILGSREVEVLRTAINTTPTGGWPSDHTPVQAVVRIGSQR